MTVYAIKPTIWNTNNYKRPSGSNLTFDWIKEQGYSLEEWNNSEYNNFTYEGTEFRMFHAGDLPEQLVDDNPGDIFIFLIASHDKRQDLVGIAGCATALKREPHEKIRSRIVKQHIADHANNMMNDAWSEDFIRKIYDNRKNDFENKLLVELKNSAAWICPKDMLYWPNNPINLHAEEISGKSKFITMHSGCYIINDDKAKYIISLIRDDESISLHNIIRYINGSDDIRYQISIEKSINNSTIKKALIDARIGQGKFRSDLQNLWHGCSVTGCSIDEVLRASHIKPWKFSNNDERLDKNNGLLLIASLDALFDRGLISFLDTGEMKISKKISKKDMDLFRIPQKLSQPLTELQKKYLSFHRDNVFDP